MLPAAGSVYVDAMAVIYSVERYPDYWPLLEPLWLAAHAGTVDVITSDLTLMEVLVKPLKTKHVKLVAAFEQSLIGTDVSLLPITQSILRDAAQLRATTKLRTPNAIHAATSRQAGCALFVTNDAVFRGITGLPVVVLDDLRTP
ncbi:MAG: PIN domain-containing protein [Planctomycetes bacterium]|nr:PIN domain-containing protein [Planctomycetota bacterium]